MWPRVSGFYIPSWQLHWYNGEASQVTRKNAQVDYGQKPLISTEDEYDSRVVQMSVLSIGTLLREAAIDFSQTLESSPTIYNTYLRSLRQWYAGLPLFLCGLPQRHIDATVFYAGLKERQKSYLVSANVTLRWKSWQVVARHSLALLRRDLPNPSIRGSPMSFNAIWIRGQEVRWLFATMVSNPFSLPFSVIGSKTLTTLVFKLRNLWSSSAHTSQTLACHFVGAL